MKRYFRTAKSRQRLAIGMAIVILSLSLIDFSFSSIFKNIENGISNLLVWTNEIVTKPVSQQKSSQSMSADTVQELLASGAVVHLDSYIISNGYISYAGSGEDRKILDIEYAFGNAAAYEYGREAGDAGDLAAVSTNNIISLNRLSYEKLANEYYIVDASTKINSDILNPKELFKEDFKIEKKNIPQILIYHTHASETYKDSKAGALEDTVTGVGEYLAELLADYGYNVIHDKTSYDKIGSADNRNKAYSTARPAIEQTLAENPGIEVIIDLHRDSGQKRVAEIDGKSMAKIMFFNGLCRNTNGPIDYLENENLEENLAFSLQMKMTGDVMYPGLFHRIYLKNYRYNMHFCEKYLLIELGTEKNTVEEAYNSMPPLADVLNTVLSGNIDVN